MSTSVRTLCFIIALLALVTATTAVQFSSLPRIPTAADIAKKQQQRDQDLIKRHCQYTTQDSCRTYLYCTWTGSKCMFDLDKVTEQQKNSLHWSDYLRSQIGKPPTYERPIERPNYGMDRFFDDDEEEEQVQKLKFTRTYKECSDITTKSECYDPKHSCEWLGGDFGCKQISRRAQMYRTLRKQWQGYSETCKAITTESACEANTSSYCKWSKPNQYRDVGQCSSSWKGPMGFQFDFI